MTFGNDSIGQNLHAWTNSCCSLFSISRPDSKRSKVLAATFFHPLDRRHLNKLHFCGLKIWGKWDDFTKLLQKNNMKMFEENVKKCDIGFCSDCEAISAFCIHSLGELLCHRVTLTSAFQAVQRGSVLRVWMRECHSLWYRLPRSSFQGHRAALFSTWLGQEWVTGAFLSRMFVLPRLTVIYFQIWNCCYSLMKRWLCIYFLSANPQNAHSVWRCSAIAPLHLNHPWRGVGGQSLSSLTAETVNYASVLFCLFEV